MADDEGPRVHRAESGGRRAGATRAALSGALEILHEDEHLLVANKPAGMLVHPVWEYRSGTLVDLVADHFAAQGHEGSVHLVHRLDRYTSGLVLVARYSHVHRALDAQLKRRGVRREYRALVDGIPPPAGLIDAPIGRDPVDKPARAVIEGGQPARTHFRVLETYGRAALVHLELDTGRTHQIRVHMAHLGHPVLGDSWYGRAGMELIGRQALHAGRLSFAHPETREEIVVEAPLPADMETLLRLLREA